MSLKFWDRFIQGYVSNNAYWYIPKGQVVKEENFESIREKLRSLKNFEGKKWSHDVQEKYVKQLMKNRLLMSRSEDIAANGRMFKTVASSLGLAWVNEHENVFITKVGNEIIKSNIKEVKEIINIQVKKFQFYNPAFKKKEGFSDIKIIPIQFLAELIYSLDEKYISREEYVLFVAKKKSNDEIFQSVEEINKFRILSDSDKNKLIKSVDEVKIESDNERRTSIYNTIWLESSYALNFFASSELFTYSSENLSLACNEKKLLDNINFFNKNNVWIDFKSHKDWFYYYGNSDIKSAVQFAMDYYLDISDVENGLNVFNKAKRLGFKSSELPMKEEEFKSVMVDEKILEDFLEKHIRELEDDLKLIGRQYPTISGPIDLLAIDSKGKFVVIELKKGRVADKVIGQVSRYVTFISKDKTLSLNKVRAIIVGKNIDRNLCMATEVLKIQCNLYEFDYKVKFDKKK